MRGPCLVRAWTPYVVVAVPCVENTLYSTDKYICVRRVHTIYISYYLEYPYTAANL